MWAAERRDVLLERLRRDGRIVAKEIAVELGLSEDSIRRDLRELASEGLLTRVYGGAVSASPAVADYATRADIATDSKRRVAAAALDLLQPGATVILDGGTTTLDLVRLLPTTLELTIVTHSPTIAAALLEHDADVILIGGRLFKHSAVAMGAAAVESASRVNADLFLLGVTGIRASTGLTTGDPEEAAMKRVLASRAAETWVLGSGEKIGAASPHQVLPLDGVSGLVLDVTGGGEALADLRETGTRIVEAGGRA
ncbi:DeoR/GlpR family DNA-binding transcription regulator [Frigoribacterium sp. CFBP9039]|uniref:DeoR/GlpR family DNA-binding transcription regulator n=1 Tax=Frigoribacterium sp. CFBP9029 TaxID=3096541 RepID=UPI002A6A4D2A|nr:DeoR/GlpR family DNA-binding transcription regulator [Frigoribacterium sp. CFBP9039]MDY0946340.1 DeoR/GlpR family DNA-binding transcription regulator [Frigoribacterium sp. CFBP9039]